MAPSLPSATCRHLLLHHLLLILLLIAGPQPSVCMRKPYRTDAEDGPRPECRGSKWNWVSLMPQLSGPHFTSLAKPLLQMCTNTYKFLYNVPPHKQHHLIPITGWSLSLKVPPAAPLHHGIGGVHALVYEENPNPSASSPPRAVLAFKGWQTSSTSFDELADLCAGTLLFSNYVDFLSPPPHLCSSLFNESTLDYLAQAVAYTHLVLQSYPSSSLLLTGHSFGAGLAVLVSTALQQHHEKCCSSNKVGGCSTSILEGLSNSHQNMERPPCDVVHLPVVSFAGPGILQDLRSWGWTLHNSCPIITISHNWDFFSVRAHWKDHLGWLCLYEKPEPASCKACFFRGLRSGTLEVFKARGSLDGGLKDKGENVEIHDIKGNVKDEDEHSDDDDENVGIDDDHNCSDDSCEGDEPCWDCLLDTHTPESLMAVVEEGLKPTCAFLGDQHIRPLPRKA